MCCRSAELVLTLPEKYEKIGDERFFVHGTQQNKRLFLGPASRQPTDPESETMKHTFLLCIVSAVIGGLIALAIYCSTVYQGQAGAAGASAQMQEPATGRQPTSDQFRSPVFKAGGAPAAARKFTAEELININVYDQVNRGVVNIDTRTLRSDVFFSRVVPEEGSGSGWILDQQGHVVTNFHVVSGSDSIDVTLFDGESYVARVIGADPANDIAVLKIDAPPTSLFPVGLGDSSSLKVGQKAFAIGNPFGLERTMTVGIISSLNRSLRSKSGSMMKGIVQIDAALNQGNSGGPLLDNGGQLIGMNTAIASSVGENTGVGFAVPANTIRRVVPELINFGKVIRPSLGIDLFVATRRGVGVGYVAPNGPAARAGIRGFVEREVRRLGNGVVAHTERINRVNADIILAVNGVEVANADQLAEEIEKNKPGDRVTLRLLRRGQVVDVQVTLGEEG